MPYLPTFPSPYLETVDVGYRGSSSSVTQYKTSSGWRGTISVEDADYSFPLYFKCLINPKDTVVAYILTIRQLSNNSQVMQVKCSPTSKTWQYGSISSYIRNLPITEIEVPIDGSSDNPWLNIKAYSRYSDGSQGNYSSLKNGTDYYWTIELFTKWEDWDDSDNVSVVSPPYFFKARCEPEITINMPDTINACNIDVIAEYSQYEDIQIACHSFDLLDKPKNTRGFNHEMNWFK